MTPVQTYKMLQHFTEKLEGNLKNVLQDYHDDKKKTRVNIPRVEGQCLSTCEMLEKLKQDDEVKKSKQLKKRKIDFSEVSHETQQVQHSNERR